MSASSDFRRARRWLATMASGGLALASGFSGCIEQLAGAPVGTLYGSSYYSPYSSFTPYTSYSPYTSYASGYDDLANDFYYGTGGSDGYYYSGIGGTVASDGETSYFFDSDSGVVIGP